MNLALHFELQGCWSLYSEHPVQARSCPKTAVVKPALKNSAKVDALAVAFDVSKMFSLLLFDVPLEHIGRNGWPKNLKK